MLYVFLQLYCVCLWLFCLFVVVLYFYWVTLYIFVAVLCFCLVVFLSRCRFVCLLGCFQLSVVVLCLPVVVLSLCIHSVSLCICFWFHYYCCVVNCRYLVYFCPLCVLVLVLHLLQLFIPFFYSCASLLPPDPLGSMGLCPGDQFRPLTVCILNLILFFREEEQKT